MCKPMLMSILPVNVRGAAGLIRQVECFRRHVPSCPSCLIVPLLGALGNTAGQSGQAKICELPKNSSLSIYCKWMTNGQDMNIPQNKYCKPVITRPALYMLM